MISTALKLIRDELSSYIINNKRSEDAITAESIILGNIAAFEGGQSTVFDNKVILTLVNTEEESALKNTPYYQQGTNGGKYVKPPVCMNLYLLITATLTTELQDSYEFALDRLSLAIQLFQSKSVFTTQNSPFATLIDDENISEEAADNIRLSVELYTLTFEQINHLWGSLGGRQNPFVMYKMRLVKIQGATAQESPAIEEIHNNLVQ